MFISQYSIGSASVHNAYISVHTYMIIPQLTCILLVVFQEIPHKRRVLPSVLQVFCFWQMFGKDQSNALGFYIPFHMALEATPVTNDVIGVGVACPILSSLVLSYSSSPLPIVILVAATFAPSTAPTTTAAIIRSTYTRGESSPPEIGSTPWGSVLLILQVCLISLRGYRGGGHLRFSTWWYG